VKFEAFCDWDRRPAVLFISAYSGYFALALLRPGADWSVVDAEDVAHTAPLFGSEAAFRKSFASRFGEFDIPSVETALVIKAAASAK